MMAFQQGKAAVKIDWTQLIDWPPNTALSLI